MIPVGATLVVAQGRHRGLPLQSRKNIYGGVLEKAALNATIARGEVKKNASPLDFFAIAESTRDRL